MASLGADQQKKLYILLGLAGALGIGLLFAFHPWSRSSSTDAGSDIGTPAPRTANRPGAAGNSPPVPPSGGSGGVFGAGGAAPVTSAAGAIPGAPAHPNAQLVSTERFRDDPFTPEIIPPTPAPPPRPTPIPPTPIPPAVPLPLPDPGINMPLVGGISANALSHNPLIMDLPPVRVSALSNPTNSPDTSVPSAIPGSTSSVLPRSPNKRISGVVIGNTVRALIEITDNEGNVVTRVVQPGDEVEGLKILRVERVREGDRSVTRMIVREDGEERVIELKPSANPQGQSGAGGSGGYPGSGGGGYPGGGGGGFAPRPPI